MSKILRATSILSSADVLSRILDVLRVAFITYTFSVNEYGIYSLATGTAILFMSFVMPNYDSLITQFLPKHEKEGAKAVKVFFSSSILLLIINSIAVITICVLSSKWIGDTYYDKPEVVNLITYASLLILFSPLADNLSIFLQSLDRFYTVFYAKISGSIANLLLVILFTYMGIGIESLIYAFVISEFLRAVILFVNLRGFFIFLKPGLSADHWTFWKPLIATSLFKALTANIPLIIMGRFLDNFFIGIFNIADRTIKMLFSILDPYLETFKTISIRKFHESHQAFVEMLNRHNLITTLLSISIGSLGIIFANLILSILYGPEYISAVPYFKLMVLYGIYGTINTSFPRVVFSTREKTHLYFISTLIFTSIQFTLSFVLTYKFLLLGLVSSLILGRAFALLLNIVICKKVERKFQGRVIVLPLILFTLIWSMTQV